MCRFSMGMTRYSFSQLWENIKQKPKLETFRSGVFLRAGGLSNNGSQFSGMVAFAGRQAREWEKPVLPLPHRHFMLSHRATANG